MHIKKGLMLAGPVLLAAVTLGPGAASPATAAQTLTERAATSVQTSTHVTGQPPDEKQKQYKRGRSEGFADGQADCENKQSYDRMHMRMRMRMRMRMGMHMGPYERGFMEGYHSGYHSCMPG